MDVGTPVFMTGWFIGAGGLIGASVWLLERAVRPRADLDSARRSS